MAVATMTSKGQITLPKAVRNQLNLKAGDRLRFEAQANGTLVGRPATRSALDLIGVLKRKVQRPVAVEDMDRSIARELKKKHGAKRRSTQK